MLCHLQLASSIANLGPNYLGFLPDLPLRDAVTVVPIATKMIRLLQLTFSSAGGVHSQLRAASLGT